jgi:hypothetical protein
MYTVLTGIMNQSVENVGQITMVINAFVTQTSDADRLRIIDEAGSRIDKPADGAAEFRAGKGRR